MIGHEAHQEILAKSGRSKIRSVLCLAGTFAANDELFFAKLSHKTAEGLLAHPLYTRHERGSASTCIAREVGSPRLTNGREQT